MAPAFVYINGYPGVGKLTVARHLRVLDNHHFIDPVAMVYERDMPEYQDLRAALRKVILDSIVHSQSTRHITWICTDSQSSDAVGKSSSLDYLAAAQARGSRFFSVILTCDINENTRRLRADGRGGDINGKLTDLNLLRSIRENFEIGRFGGEDEIEINGTDKTAIQTAREIADFVQQRSGQT